MQWRSHNIVSYLHEDVHHWQYLHQDVHWLYLQEDIHWMFTTYRRTFIGCTYRGTSLAALTGRSLAVLTGGLQWLYLQEDVHWLFTTYRRTFIGCSRCVLLLPVPDAFSSTVAVAIIRFTNLLTVTTIRQLWAIIILRHPNMLPTIHSHCFIQYKMIAKQNQSL